MTTTPLPPPGVNIAAGNWTAVTDCRYYTADQMQAYSTQARADLEAENARLREALQVLVDNGGIGPEWMFDDARAALKDTK